VLNVWVARQTGRMPPSRSRAMQDGNPDLLLAYTSQHLLYLQDDGGDENWKVHVVDLRADTDRDLTPFDTIPGPDGQPIRLPNGKPMRPRPRSRT